MGNIRIGEIEEFLGGSNNEQLLMKICVRIAAFLSSIPPFITILIFIIQNKQFPMTLQHKIQIMMCISFLGLEASFFFPRITDEDIILCGIQGTISFSFFVINCCWQFIHSYIAYKLFTNPLILSKCSYKFLLLYFPWIVLIILGAYIFYYSDLRIFYGLMVFPKDIISKILANFLIFFFFIANIITTIKLLIKVKKTLNQANKTAFHKEKYCMYRKKLLCYIFGMILTYHPCIIMGLGIVIYGKNPDWLDSFPFSLHYYLVEALSGFINWHIYVCNKKLWKRFLIMMCLLNKEYEYIEDSENNDNDEGNETNEILSDIAVNSTFRSNIQLKDLSYGQSFLDKSDYKNNYGINNTNSNFDDEEL